MFTFDASVQRSPWLAVQDDHHARANPASEHPGERQHTRIDAATQAPKMVYIVEDGSPTGHDVRAVVRTLLPVESSVIRTYRSVESFLEQAGQHRPGVVIVNGCLSPSGSIALLCGLKSGELAFAVILLTLRADVALAVCAMKHGAVDVLAMPCTPQSLAASMDVAFDQVDRRFALRTTMMAARARIDQLSRRERTVLTGVVRGWSNKRMASDLDLSPRTVEIHRANLMHKLGAGHLADVLRIVYDAGLIDEI